MVIPDREIYWTRVVDYNSNGTTVLSTVVLARRVQWPLVLWYLVCLDVQFWWGPSALMAGEMRARGGDVQAKTGSETPCLTGATALPPRLCICALSRSLASHPQAFLTLGVGVGSAGQVLFNRIGWTDVYNVDIRCLANVLIRGGRALRESWPRPRGGPRLRRGLR